MDVAVGLKRERDLADKENRPKLETNNAKRPRKQTVKLV